MSALPHFVAEPNPEVYLGDNYVVIDFETTNREFGTALDEKNSLILACWRFGNAHPLYQHGRDNAEWGGEYDQSRLVDACLRADFVVAHNAKFEYGWLKRCGLDLRKVLCFDTMIAEKVIAGNRKYALSLQATAARRGMGTKEATVSALIKAGVCPSQIPATMLASYCDKDVALTESVFLAQRQELRQLALLPVAYCRNLVTPVLADIEFNGMTLDTERVNETWTKCSEEYASLEAELHREAGGINFKSPKQMREHIYVTLGFKELEDHKGRTLKTDSGGARTDKHTLAALSAETPEQDRFLKLAQSIAKLKVPVQNLTKMKAIVDGSPEDPRVYAQFNQTITQTDRLSSSARKKGFQFHNLDRAFKKLFKARGDSRVMCEADAPQLEFRVAAYLGHDEVAKRDIQEGVDVHAATARTLGVKRQDAKAFTFKPLYGGNSGTPRQRKYYDYFRNRYGGIYRTQSGWTLGVARDKFLVTPWGLRFYWPDTEIKDGGYVTNTTQIYNYPIQSFATADIIPLTLVLLWHSVGHLEDSVTVVNTIHDSIIAEVEPSALDEYKAILRRCFTEDIYWMLERLYGITFDVPMGVGIKASKYWGEGEEEKYEPTAHKNELKPSDST